MNCCKPRTTCIWFYYYRGTSKWWKDLESGTICSSLLSVLFKDAFCLKRLFILLIWFKNKVQSTETLRLPSTAVWTPDYIILYYDEMFFIKIKAILFKYASRMEESNFSSTKGIWRKFIERGNYTEWVTLWYLVIQSRAEIFPLRAGSIEIIPSTRNDPSCSFHICHEIKCRFRSICTQHITTGLACQLFY